MASGQQDLKDRMKNMSPSDWMIVGGGIGAFLFSFFPFWGVSLGGFGSASFNAWHGLLLLGLLLLFATVAVWVLHLLEAVTLPELPLPLPLALAIGAGLGSVILLVRGLTYPHGSLGTGHNLHYSYGMKFGGFLLVIAGLVMTAGAIWAAQTAPKTAKGRTGASGGVSPAAGWTPPVSSPGAPPSPPMATPPSPGAPPGAPGGPPTIT